MLSMRRRRSPDEVKPREDNVASSHGMIWDARWILRDEGRLFQLLLAFRLANALLTQTYFVPDEHWQGLEVAHRLVFGYGYLTWEWREQIRSVAHPMIFACVYKLLAILGLEDGQLFILAPRLVQAAIAALGDLYTCKLTKRFFNEATAQWALFCSVISWFNFLASVRTLSNSMEMALTVVALYYWPWPALAAVEGITWEKRKKTLRASLCLAAASCILRPTNAYIWAFIGLNLLANESHHAVSIIANVLFITIPAVGAMVATDYAFYGKAGFVPYNFVYFNIAQNISLFYGSHPWHWYLSQGIPMLITTQLPFFIKGLMEIYQMLHWRTRARPMVLLIAWVVVGYSLLGHKEVRFVHPLLPVLTAITAVGAGSSCRSGYLRTIVVFLLITNVPIALYSSLVHQRGVMDVMAYLRTEASDPGRVQEVGFLMPCHSTPFYSSLHRPVPMWFLTCEPPLNKSPEEVERYKDEADQFYADPHGFLANEFEPLPTRGDEDVHKQLPAKRKWPNYLVLFEALLKDIGSMLKESRYRECARFFNSHFHDDWRRRGDVIVYCFHGSDG